MARPAQARPLFCEPASCPPCRRDGRRSRVRPQIDPSPLWRRRWRPRWWAIAKPCHSFPDSKTRARATRLARRWRQRHEHALLVVDQAEELFTLNAIDGQRRFAELLGRFVLEADVHVLLSLRDDFLLQCQSFEALRPIFSELIPLTPPLGAALRRAVVQPALLSGYRFEDERLVDDMLRDVAQERGALPLLAFAMARLWEHRDREHGLFTRRGYEEIGGVAGALLSTQKRRSRPLARMCPDGA